MPFFDKWAKFSEGSGVVASVVCCYTLNNTSYRRIRLNNRKRQEQQCCKEAFHTHI